MTQPLLVIAAGGTGGHMFPAQALAEHMLRAGWRVKLSTDERGARYTGGFPHTVEIEHVKSATFSRGGLIGKLRAPFSIGIGALSAIRAFRRDRPTVVVGFGGYPSIPALAAATALRLPRMIHEQNGVLGRVNAVFARQVHTLACAVWPTELPSGVDAVHTGNPIRATVRSLAASPMPPFDGPLNILIFGGSQGASILSASIPAGLAQLPQDMRQRLNVSHQAREADHDQAAKAYAEAGITVDIRPFFEDLPDRLMASHLVISRSGASSVADIAAIGRPSILVPLAAAIRDEQTANARALVEAGAALLLTEPDLTPDRVRQEVAALLASPDTLIQMAAAARDQGKPDAVDLLKHEVAKLAGLT